MKKIVVVGLLVLALALGFVFIQSAQAHGPMMGRGFWWQPSAWGQGAYRPWNNWGYNPSAYPNYPPGYGWRGCGMMNPGWVAGYWGNPYNFPTPQQLPQGK